MTDTNEEWSPWYDHDGTGMPVAGEVIVQVRAREGDEDLSDDDLFAEAAEVYVGWEWPAGSDAAEDIVSYRVAPEDARRAAADEMFAALEAMLLATGEGPRREAALAKARRALDRARGKPVKEPTS
jgi:hypothetical protein